MTNHALERPGDGVATAILQAARRRRLYRRAGFEFGRIVEYKPPAAASRSST
jgi:hypothetical protein